MPATQHIMRIIANETHGESYSTAKYCLDSVRVPYIEYDDAERKIEVERAKMEAHRGYVDVGRRAEEIKNDEPLLKYFLDGSRHVCKVDDIAYNKKVFPVMAEQVGVGCLKRSEKRMHCASFARKWVVALPSYSNADGLDDKNFFAKLSNTHNERLSSSGVASGVYPTEEACFEVAMYKPYLVQAKGQKKVSLEDKATAVIQDCMMREEKQMVSELAGQKVLRQSAYLVKDGSLEYMSTNSKDPLDLRRIRNNYRWVIGVSKHFNPMLFTDSRGNANPKAIAQLPLFHRTPAVRFDGGDEGKDRFGGVKFAVWYLRLRKKGAHRHRLTGWLKWSASLWTAK